MKISLLVEDRKKGVIKIPVTKSEVRDMFDLIFLLEGTKMWKTLKLNKLDNNFVSICRKFMHIKNDVLGEGRMYCFNENNEFVLEKARTYFYGRPRWSKYEAPRGEVLFKTKHNKKKSKTKGE